MEGAARRGQGCARRVARGGGVARPGSPPSTISLCSHGTLTPESSLHASSRSFAGLYASSSGATFFDLRRSLFENFFACDVLRSTRDFIIVPCRFGLPRWA